MRSIVIANIGNSDLGKEEKPYFDMRRNNIYEHSKQLYESRRYDFGAILLEPVIKEIVKEYEIERLYLFATKQRPVHPKDTIYVAYIVKEILDREFGFGERIEVVQIDENPADYDTMFGLYEGEMGRISTDADVIHVSITGGTPAQNMALLIKSLLAFGNKVQVVYKLMGSKEVEKFKIGEAIVKILLMEQLKALKKRHLYGSAAQLAEKYNLLELKEILMLKAKEHRVLFNFEESVKVLRKVLNGAHGEERARIKSEIEDIERIEEGLKGRERFSEEYFLTYRALIKELVYNMKLKWDQGAYADFLGRLFRFEEAVLRYTFEKEFNVSTEIDESKEYPAFKEIIESNNKLKRFLEESGIKSEEPNRRTLFMILTFLKKENPDRTDIKEIQEIIGKIEKLADLRNKSILGHGFKGISRDRIKEIYRRDILSDIERVVELM